MSRQTDLNNHSIIQVVVLVLENSQGDILITQRPTGKHLEDFWEFPGGKTEPQESLLDALKRESIEEINYLPVNPTQLTSIEYQYPEKLVQLHVFHCLESNPEVLPNENQPMKWVHKSKLHQVQLPPANAAIIKLINK